MPVPQIVLNYARFTFNSTHKTVAWKFENSQSCTPPVTYSLQSSTCDRDVVGGTWITPNMEYSLPLSALIAGSEVVYFNITARSTHGGTACAVSPRFQIDPVGKRNVLDLFCKLTVFYKSFVTCSKFSGAVSCPGQHLLRSACNIIVTYTLCILAR